MIKWPLSVLILLCNYTTMWGSIALCYVHVNGEFSSHKKVNYEVPQLVKPKACLKDTRPEIPLIYYFVHLLISEKTGLDVLRPKTTWWRHRNMVSNQILTLASNNTEESWSLF